MPTTDKGDEGERKRKLAAALRDNLIKRKTQARARRDRPEAETAATLAPKAPAR
ncbi:MAG: hypothetical protein WCF85_04055 [Rhodospirillaceae bacterium]